MKVRIIAGEAHEELRGLADESVNCVLTSPAYWAHRDYADPRQLGHEPTPQRYVANLVRIFREVRRVLRKDGTCWLVLGDAFLGHDKTRRKKRGRPRKGERPYGGLKRKDLCLLPHRAAIALQEDGWWVRGSIIWHKPNAIPTQALDRPCLDYELMFLLTRSQRYYFNADAVRTPLKQSTLDRALRGGWDPPEGWNEAYRGQPPKGLLDKRCQDEKGAMIRSVWSVSVSHNREQHFAMFPLPLIDPCIKAGCPRGGTVLDPFAGAGTVGIAAAINGCNSVLIELNPLYAELARDRINREVPIFVRAELETSVETKGVG